MLVQFAAVHHIHCAKVGRAEAAGDFGLELGFAGSGPFGGDDDHPRIGLGAIHGGGAGVFQHRYIFNIVGVIVAANDPVYHDERRLRCVYGRNAAHAYFSGGAGNAGAAHYLQAGHFSLEHGSYVVGGNIFQLSRIYYADGAGKLTFLLVGVTHYHYQVQLAAGRLQRYLHPVTGRQLLFFATGKGEHEDFARVGGHGELSGGIGGNAPGGAFYHYRGAGQRCAVGPAHDAAYFTQRIRYRRRRRFWPDHKYPVAEGERYRLVQEALLQHRLHGSIGYVQANRHGVFKNGFIIHDGSARLQDDLGKHFL